MKIPWRRLWVGLKIAVGVAIKLNDKGVIKVKELDKATPILEAIQKERERQKSTP